MDQLWINLGMESWKIGKLENKGFQFQQSIADLKKLLMRNQAMGVIDWFEKQFVGNLISGLYLGLIKCQPIL